MQDGVPAIREERHRLLWDNLPIWFRVRDLSNFLAERGAALIAATYTAAWAETTSMLMPDDPYLSIAKTYSYVILNRSLDYRKKRMLEMARQYHCDGVILHSDRSCKPYSIGMYSLQDELTRLTGKPGVVIEADQNDPRAYSDAQVETRLEAFIESMEPVH